MRLYTIIICYWYFPMFIQNENINMGVNIDQNLEKGGRETASGFQKHSFETVLQTRLRFSKQILYSFNKCIAPLCHIEEQFELELLFFSFYMLHYMLYTLDLPICYGNMTVI